jgi:hypothetical protein
MGPQKAKVRARRGGEVSFRQISWKPAQLLSVPKAGTSQEMHDLTPEAVKNKHENGSGPPKKKVMKQYRGERVTYGDVKP